MPSFIEEERLVAEGYRLIAGVDEVGRGALAGPVVAAAVILPEALDASDMEGVADSKQLSPAERERLFIHIHKIALSVGVGAVPHHVIDEWGIIRATRLAMKQAVEQLSPSPQSLLIDYMQLPEVNLYQRGIAHGDDLCFSIACASIIAKVTRDRLMVEFDGEYPGYGMARHKGYGTRQHIACLAELGVCPIHRRSFRPVREMVQGLFRESNIIQEDTDGQEGDTGVFERQPRLLPGYGGGE
ncbi:MAG: ribonuclease HII [Dehalococcoidia bacterium]|jgi:ribonuclease HII